MVQQSWSKVWVKKERFPKKNNSSNATKANKLAEQISAGVTKGEDKCKYSRDLLLKNFTPEKADLVPTAAVSTPTTTACDSKGSSVVGSPELPPPLTLSEALGAEESKEYSGDFSAVYGHMQETTNQEVEQNYIWFGEMAFDPLSSWNNTFGNEMMTQFPLIPDFPIQDVPASLPVEQPTEKTSKRKAGKGSSAEAGPKAGFKADTKESTKAGKKTDAKASGKAPNPEGGKAGKKGGGKTGGKSGTKAADLSAIAELVAQDIAMPVTTMMLRNIPNECTRDQLFEHLEKTGFQGKIDFIYLPINFSTDRNFGYSFLNFRTPEAASSFMEAFNGVAVGKCLPAFKGEKACKVVAAAVQGWEANMRKLCGSNSALRALGPEHWHPLFLDAAGQKVELTGGYRHQKVAKRSMNPDASEFVPDGLNPSASEYVPESLNTQVPEFVPGAAEFVPSDYAGDFVNNNTEMDEQWLQHLARVQVQVEYYFSANNLEKDFYLKSIMDKDGWVEVSALAQFNRMKQMNADVQTIASAVSISLFVELSADGQWIRSVYPSEVTHMTAPEGSPS